MNKKDSIILLILICGLLIAGWCFRHSMNVDAVAYLRIAEYYAKENYNLAISGYWGVLLSWIAVPFLVFGASPLIAGRIAMGISALIFYFACASLIEKSSLSDKWKFYGKLTTAGISIIWSIQQITPDLLMSGFFIFASVQLMNGQWVKNWESRRLCGLCFGLAFLSKAVALPISILTLLGFSFLEIVNGKTPAKKIIKSSVIVVIILGIISGLWIAVLTNKYGRLTVSTSGIIAHSIANKELNKAHPFALTFHKPEPGRITSWEDPEVENYKKWSPFESHAYFVYQVKLIIKNAGTIILGLMLMYPLIILVLTFLLIRNNSGGNSGGEKAVIRMLIPLCATAGVYLPVYVSLKELRYLYAGLPFIYVASAIAIESIINKWRANSEKYRSLAPVVASVILLITCSTPALVQGFRSREAGLWAHKIAYGIIRNNIQGDIAGSGLVKGGRIGLFTAFLLNRVWSGDSLEPQLEEVKNSGATIFIATIGSPLEKLLSKYNDFEDISYAIYINDFDRKNTPVRIFRLKKI